MPTMPDTWDDVDRQIAAVLQIAGRASWGAVARFLDLPERTVARRGQRLIDLGVIKVSTYLDAITAYAARSVVVRLRAASGQARAVAASVAERADASSVSILEGSRQVVALLILSDQARVATVLLDELPAIPGVVSSESTTVLRPYRSGYDWMATGVISAGVRAEVEAEILGALDDGTGPVSGLTEADERLIALLAEDGRMPATRLAEQLGLKTGAVRRRIEQLIATGTLRVRAEVRPSLFGLHVEAMAWLRVPPSRVDDLGRRLAESGSVRFCSATTGEFQLMVDVLARDEHELLEFLAQTVGSVDGARTGEVELVLAPVRRGPLSINVGEFA
ncbi:MULTISPECIES: Lrp/AsnC family transcriptional regulator [unclassified Leucobacter]|uniref:Lrp/AsnC family transcriptional regulator n=1 Tax=unclassified Leucobacter TaxID=2621730 RepID=UPI00165DE200|nr:MULTISPECIES: Lrp/AsnC family transcriptional regulator [unclassified Leucobacter]MBC9937290.1 Lrp/AsnC family transcriptional regulator [Leucobacter sp. cx-87]